MTEDYISKQQAIEAVNDQLLKVTYDWQRSWNYGVLVARYAIEKLQPITPTKGEWTEVEKSEHGGLSIVSMRCPRCGRYAYIVLPKGTKCVYDYCPWCKADMRGGYNE